MRTPGQRGAVALILGTVILAQGCAAIIGADFGDDPVPLDAGGADEVGDLAEAQADVGEAGAADANDAGEERDAACGPVTAAPSTLLTSGTSPQFFALGASALYLTTGQAGLLYACALPGGCGTTPTTLYFGKDVYGITVDSQNTYATDYITGDLVVCGLSGCLNAPQQVGPGLSSGGFGGGVRIAGNDVLWADVSNVYEAPLSNVSAFQSIATGSAIDDVAYAPDYNGGTVFWSDTGASTIYSCQLASCTDTRSTVIAGQLSPAYLAIDANHLYWTDAVTGNGSVNQVNLDGTGPTTLASAQSNPWGIAVDTNCVYWAENAARGSVKRCAIGGCDATPSVVAAGQATPIGVAVDGTYIYWSNQSDGTVKKVAK